MEFGSSHVKKKFVRSVNTSRVRKSTNYILVKMTILLIFNFMISRWLQIVVGKGEIVICYRGIIIE